MKSDKLDSWCQPWLSILVKDLVYSGVIHGIEMWSLTKPIGC